MFLKGILTENEESFQRKKTKSGKETKVVRRTLNEPQIKAKKPKSRRETILLILKTREGILSTTISKETKTCTNNFIPQRSNKHFRLIFQNLNSLKLHQDNEVQRSLETIKSYRGDMLLMQEVNINLHKYTNRIWMEQLRRKKSLNYRFNYGLGGQDTYTSNIKGVLMTIHHPSTFVHITHDEYFR